MKPSDERIQELTDKLEKGIAQVFDSDQYALYLKTMSKFHRYSFRNVMLIFYQCPEASRVAGFNAWKKDFGRTVKRGEHGIQILAPVTYTTLEAQPVLDPVTLKPLLNSDGTEKTIVSIRPFPGPCSIRRRMRKNNASLDTISNTAKEIIDGIESRCPELFQQPAQEEQDQDKPPRRRADTKGQQSGTMARKRQKPHSYSAPTL